MSHEVGELAHARRAPPPTAGNACGATSFLAALAALAAAACSQHRGAPSPGEAQERLAAAVAARSPARLWAALDRETRWSWMSIQRAWREAHDITLSNVPEGPERERLVRRFEPGATAESAEDLFARRLPSETWTTLATRLAAARGRAPVTGPGGDRAETATPAGALTYRRADKPSWGWGYSGLAAAAEDLKRRAAADLELMRTSAAEYERAVTRGVR
jgi:hypothetical protein